MSTRDDDRPEQSTVETAEDASSASSRAGQSSQVSQEDFFAESMAELQKERDQYYDLLLRKQAEFDNYRRRTEREKSDVRWSAMRDVLREVLEALDACDQGLKSMEQHDANLESYREGYLLLQRQLRSLLAKFGVEDIEAAGQPFDPNLHEAVVYEASSEQSEGTVIQELKKGYRLKGQLLRPAQVKVARAS